MAQTFSINIDLNDFKSKNNILLKQLEDFSPAFKEYIIFHQTVIVPGLFKTKGGSGGKKWSNYSDGYAKLVGRKSPTMIRTKSLFNAATGGDGWFEDVEKDTFSFGIDGNIIPYANRHQVGTDGMPQRIIIGDKDNGLTKRGFNTLLKIMDNHIKKGIK